MPTAQETKKREPRFSQDRRRVQISFEDAVDMTEQAHKDECDIHNIMLKQKRTGLLNHVNKYQGSYGDFTGQPDFAEAQQMITEANSMFETVPADIRAKFDNDAARFISYMQDENNADAIEEMGLDASHLRTDTAKPVLPSYIPQEGENNKQDTLPIDENKNAPEAP